MTTQLPVYKTANLLTVSQPKESYLDHQATTVRGFASWLISTVKDDELHEKFNKFISHPSKGSQYRIKLSDYIYNKYADLLPEFHQSITITREVKLLGTITVKYDARIFKSQTEINRIIDCCLNVGDRAQLKVVNNKPYYIDIINFEETHG